MNKFASFVAKNRLYVIYSLFAALMLASCFWMPASYIGFGLLALGSIFDNLKNGVSYIIFGVPFCLINTVYSGAIFIGTVLICLIKIYYVHFVKQKNKISLSTLFFVVLFLFYCLMPTGKYNFDWLLRLGIFAVLFGALGAIVIKPEVFRFKFNVRIVAIATILSALIGLARFLPMNSAYGQVIVWQTRYMALMTNANVFAMLCELTLGLLAYLIITQKGRWQDLVLFVMVAACGIFTISKTFIIILIFLLIALFIWALTVNWRVAFGSFILLLGIFAIAYLCVPNFFINYFNRFASQIQAGMTFNEIMTKLTTGRWVLWQAYSTYLVHNPLQFVFGSGLGAQLVAGAFESPHNGYLAIVYELGIVGALLFIAAIGVLLYRLSKKVKFSKAACVPFLVVMLLLMAEDTMFFIFQLGI